jgi:hypothetical protein
MSVTNGLGPATSPIKFGPGFTDNLPSGKQFSVHLGWTASSPPVAEEPHEPNFNRVKFVQQQSISTAAPAILGPTLLRPEYFRVRHFCVENISILITNRMTDLLFLVGERWARVGNRWAILWLFTLKYPADTGRRCSSAARVQVVRIHKRCV